jgi:hypothetical protein
MKIFLAPSTIKAVCDLAIKAIDDARAAEDKRTLAPYRTGYKGFWLWKKPFTRTIEEQEAAYHHDMRPRMGVPFYTSPFGGYPCNFGRDVRQRCINLRAIARHKMTAGLIEVPDPYLSDIAQFLGPDEDTRI